MIWSRTWFPVITTAINISSMMDCKITAASMRTRPSRDSKNLLLIITEIWKKILIRFYQAFLEVSLFLNSSKTLPTLSWITLRLWLPCYRRSLEKLRIGKGSASNLMLSRNPKNKLIKWSESWKTINLWAIPLEICILKRMRATILDQPKPPPRIYSWVTFTQTSQDWHLQNIDYFRN